MSLIDSEAVQIVARDVSASGDPNILRVLFSTGETLRLHVSDWVELGLKVGMSVNPASFAEINARSRCVDAERLAVSYLTGRIKTVAQMRSYMQRKDIEPDVIDMVIHRLEARGILDDALYAAWFVERDAGRLGRAQLLQRLRSRGVDTDTARDAVNQHLTRDLEVNTAMQIGAKYLRRRGPIQNSKDRMRLLAHLYGKGVQSDMANEVAQRLERLDDSSSTPDS